MKKQSQQQGFEDQEDEKLYNIGPEKNLNKERRGNKKPGPSKNWFKNF